MNNNAQNEAMQRCQAAIMNLVMVCYNIMLLRPGEWKGSRPVQVRHAHAPNLGTAYDHLWLWGVTPEFDNVFAKLADMVQAIRTLPAGASTKALVRQNPEPRIRPERVNREWRQALLLLMDTLVPLHELGSSYPHFRLVWNVTCCEALCMLMRDDRTPPLTRAVLASMFVEAMDFSDDTHVRGPKLGYLGGGEA